MDAVVRELGPKAEAPSKNLERLVGPEGWSRLPRAVVARFGGAATSAEFAGEGDFEANAVGRLFACLGVLFGRPLPLGRGKAAVFIRVTPTPAGEAWSRLYGFDGRDELVRSIKHKGDGDWLEERAGALVMRLKVFEDRGALVFECIDFRLRLGPLELKVPLALTPGRIRVEHHDHGAGRFAFTLEAHHPWFGRTFAQRCDLHDVGGRP
jgi:uncharacterized protein DUF4166